MDILNSTQETILDNLILNHIPDNTISKKFNNSGSGTSLIVDDYIFKTISVSSNLILSETSNTLIIDYPVPSLSIPYAKITRDNSSSSPQSTTTSWVNISTNMSYSSSSDFTIVTNGIQINTTGKYNITVKVNIKQTTLLLTYIVGAALFINGVIVEVAQNSFNTSLTNYIPLIITTPKNLNINDLLEMRVRSTVAGATVENYSTFESGTDLPCAELSVMKIG